MSFVAHQYTPPTALPASPLGHRPFSPRAVPSNYTSCSFPYCSCPLSFSSAPSPVVTLVQSLTSYSRQRPSSKLFQLATAAAVDPPCLLVSPHRRAVPGKDCVSTCKEPWLDRLAATCWYQWARRHNHRAHLLRTYVVLRDQPGVVRQAASFAQRTEACSGGHCGPEPSAEESEASRR